MVDLTARLLAAAVRRDPGLVRDLLPTVLPWARFLPSGRRQADGRRVRFHRRGRGLDRQHRSVSQLVTEWRHTAEIHADPDLHRVLSAPSADDFGPVARPAGE